MSFAWHSVKTEHNRANRERKRLARKRARAAKREHEREEPKVAGLRSVPEGRGKCAARVALAGLSRAP